MKATRFNLYKIFFGLIISLVFFSILKVPAQSISSDKIEEQEPPTAPYVEEAPDESEWVVTFKPKKTDPPKPTDPEELKNWEIVQRLTPKKTETRIYKKGDSKAVIRIMGDGTKGEEWILKGTRFLMLHYFKPSDVLINKISAASPDFPELSWLDIKYYKNRETEPETKIKSFLFEISGGEQAEIEYEAGLPRDIVLKLDPIQVWIDIKTMLPVAMETGEYRMSYKFKKLGTMPKPGNELDKIIQNYFSENE